MEAHIYLCVCMCADIPIWSKLETGRIPSPQEMFQMVEYNMKMGGGGPR